LPPCGGCLSLAKYSRKKAQKAQKEDFRAGNFNVLQ
jgi:hypothetical protein